MASKQTDCELSPVKEESKEDQTHTSTSVSPELIHSSNANDSSISRKFNNVAWVVFMSILCFMLGYWIRSIHSFGFKTSAQLTKSQS